MIKISFAGGSNIGASCTLIEVNDTRILIDCGVRFKGESRLPDLSILSGKHLDAVLVTHAHSDHTGALPVVCEAFPRAPVYASPPTMEIAMILLRDAVRLMDAERESELPLYAQKQVDQVLNAFVPVQHDHTVDIGDTKVRFLPAGHILGASMLHLETPFGNVLFTGDFSVTAQRTVPALGRPSVTADLVVSEATYGERLHEDRAQAETRLVESVRAVLQNGGRVLIPAFAVGRAQEVLLILKNALRNKSLPEVPVFVDGMVRAVCDVYGRHDRYVTKTLFHEIRKAAHPFYTNGIVPVENAAARRAVLDAGPCAIVASSGMLSGGASTFYAEALAPNADDAILLTGYQDEESPGRALLNQAESQGPREIPLAGRTVPISCKFEKYGLSAHADRLQTATFIEGLRPKTVVLVHGDNEAKRALAASLSTRDIIVPDDGRFLERSFPVRKRDVSATTAAPEREMTTAALRSVLGPPSDRPISARTVAEAWFGRRVTGEEVAALIAAVETAQLARRDDRRRDLLHVLSPSETDSFPDEAALEQALKTENPKGRLLEWAMRTRIEPPETTFDVEGAFHKATMSVVLNGQTITEGPCRAAAKKTAEQLAARGLLVRIEAETSAGNATFVDEAEGAALKSRNPKGRLLETLTAGHLPPPVETARTTVDGFNIQLAVDMHGVQINSGWYVAKSKKIAAHAAAAALLEKLRTAETEPLSAENPPAVLTPPAPSPKEPTATTGRDPMMLLNELRQVGLLRTFDYRTTSTAGPSHQPVFTIVCFAELENGERIESSPTTASSKKEARRQAASDLVQLLRAEGITS